MRLEDRAALIMRPVGYHDTWDDELVRQRCPHHDCQGYVHMEHGDTYGIWLRNHAQDITDVIIEINGKEVGGWRLEGFVTATIERPADETGKFTFYEIGSSESLKAGLDLIDRNDLNLVKVTFIPKRHVKPHAIPALLSGKPEQPFVSADAIERDYDRQVTINLRLITKPRDKPKSLRRVSTSNVVPPPIN